MQDNKKRMTEVAPNINLNSSTPATRVSTFLSSKQDIVEEGDTVILYLTFGQCMPIRVRRGSQVQMKFGALRHEFIIGKPYGSKVSATKGFVFILRPTCSLWTQSLPHRTQIIYPPDISLILTLLEARPGSRIVEAGMGSAAVSHAFCRTIAPNGHLFTYEVDSGRHKAGLEEMRSHGLGPELVTVNLRNVCTEGFAERPDEKFSVKIDGVFLDLPSPWEAIPYAANILKQNGGRIVTFSPCIEQVARNCEALKANGFTKVRTTELVMRNHKISEFQYESVRVAAKDESNLKKITKRPGGKRKADDSSRQVEDEDSALGSGGNHAAEEGVQSLVSQVFPPQQPTHTGYLTAASLYA